MNYAEIKKYDIANGPGVRTSLFVSGCTHYCKNCFNKETWDPHFGKEFTEETIIEILDSISPEYIGGLTLLGGDPFCYGNEQALLSLVKRFRLIYPRKNIWCYTGSTLEELMDSVKKESSEVAISPRLELLQNIDVLVDGPFIEEKKDLSIRFRGSSNQRIINMKNTMKVLDELDLTEIYLMNQYM